MTENYDKMWDDFAKVKAPIYHRIKFKPVTRIGLTNYIREKLIFEYPSFNKKQLALDVGCASGKQTLELTKYVKIAYGVDISKNFIKVANQMAKQQKIKNAVFKTSKSEKLPFKDKMFDVVICCEVLEHVEDLKSSFNELNRVTKDNGQLLITVPNLNSDGTIHGRFLRKISLRSFSPLKVFTTEGIKQHKDSHVREFTIDTISKECRKYGFKVRKWTTVAYVDLWDLPINIILKIPLFRKLLISVESFLSKRNLKYGRNIVLICQKEKVKKSKSKGKKRRDN